jgi:hypothetical protein
MIMTMLIASNVVENGLEMLESQTFEFFAQFEKGALHVNSYVKAMIYRYRPATKYNKAPIAEELSILESRHLILLVKFRPTENKSAIGW